MIKLSAFIALFILNTSIFAKIQIKDIHLVETGQTGQAEIVLNGELRDIPEITVKEKMIQVAIPGATVWPKIEKKVSVNQKFDANLMAYQYNKKLVRFRIHLPFSLKGKETQVNLTLKDNKILLNFPKLKSVKKITNLKKKAKPIEAEAYDESYLNKLLNDQETIGKDQLVEKAPVVSKGALEENSDRVKSAFSAPRKEPKSSFSLVGYVGKFIAFLTLILVCFYGIIRLIKKGALKKGRLGFLKSSDTIEVLNTTYVGPKRNLMMVKVHNQVFLIGNSEKGMDLISELKDTAGIVKKGEASITGNNFDTDLDATPEKNFTLKEDIEAIAAENNEAVRTPIKLADQIKDKLKNLKPLH